MPKGDPILTLDCLTCGAEFERKKGRPSHFCEECRQTNNRERTAARMRELRAAEKAATEKIAEYRAFGMSDEFIQRYTDDLSDIVAEMRSETVPRDYVPDRMPVGSNAPAGPDEGCSTGWSDLADELDRRADDAAIHPWFTANPHWSYALHDEDVNLDNLKGR